jgi:hypothetical protein
VPQGEGGDELDTGGAGRGGGLLFVGVLAFVAYLLLTAVPGVLGIIVAVGVFALAVVLLARVLRRR